MYNDENIYREEFTRSGLQSMEDVRYKYDAILEEHPESYGWEAGAPRISKESDGTYTLVVPLTQYKDRKDKNRNGLVG